MSTTAQLTANRANAQHSTGPATEAGKQSASRNALKHGLYAKNPVIPGESAAEFTDLRDQILAEYRPRLAEDILTCEQLIDAIWRSRRIERLETAWFTRNPDPDFCDPKVFRVWAEFGRQHARCQRLIQSCLKRLSHLDPRPLASFPQSTAPESSDRRQSTAAASETRPIATTAAPIASCDPVH